MQESGERSRWGWLQPVGIVVSLGFMVWYAVREWAGIREMLVLLRDAVFSGPEFFGDILAYYEAVPSDLLWPSVLIGAAFGGLVTPIFALRNAGNLSIKSPGGIWIAVFPLILAFYLNESIWYGMLGGLGLAVLAASIDRHFRQGMAAQDWSALVRPQALWVGGRALLVGLLAGGLGSQLIIYPTQHCTFAPDISQAQYNLGILTTFVGAFVLLLPAWTVLFWKPGQLSDEGTAGFFRNVPLAYGFLVPTLALLGLFLYYPAVQIFLTSLERSRFPLPQTQFVCLDNYMRLTDDVIYQNSFTSTLYITVALVVLTMSIALLIATLATQKVRGASVYRTLLIWPFALSPVVAGVIFLGLFREGGVGFVNLALDTTIGIQPRWLRDPDLAPWVIILASVWNGLGFNILLYMAGLQNIPDDLLEAAAIDGANVVQRFLRITIPLLSPFTFFLLVVNITYAFYGIYGAVDAITQGGPPLGPGGSEGGATNILIYKLYGDAFGAGAPVGLAGAQALILFVMVAALTILQFRVVERRVTYSA